MTVSVKMLIGPKYMESTQTTQYTSTSVKTIIDAFTITNNDTVARTFSVNIVPSGGSVGADNKIVKDQTVQAGETYPVWQLIGHDLDVGAFISTIASSASALTMYVSGRQVS